MEAPIPKSEIKKKEIQKPESQKSEIDYTLHLKIIREKFRRQNFEEIKYHGSTGCLRVKIPKGPNQKGNWEYVIKETQEIEKSKKEMKILFAVNHPNIVRFIGYFMNEANVCLVFEYMPYDIERARAHNLRKYKKLIKLIIFQVLRALAYLHDNSIVYRDISLTNIMISFTGAVKLIDFDNAKNVQTSGIPNTTRGTPGFISPEILEGMGPYNEKTDIFSLGILAYYCYFNRSIVENLDKGRFEILEELQEKIYELETMTDFASLEEQEFIFFVRRCLRIDPEKRASALELLEDDWLAEIASMSTEKELYHNTKKQLVKMLKKK